MDSLVRLIVSSVIRSGIYRMMYRRSGKVLIFAVATAILAYVWMHS